MSHSNLDHVPERAEEVLRYFARNPHAADSFEGVARWRLREEAIHRSVEEIKQALDWLVAQGFLLAQSRAGAARIFSLNPDQAQNADRFLRGTRGAAAQELDDVIAEEGWILGVP